MPVKELARSMFVARPHDVVIDEQVLARCIEACVECAQACSQCADDCLGEPTVADLVRCIRLDMDCADICEMTARIISRQTEGDATLMRAQLEACAVACRACAEECTLHAGEGMEHCAVCAEQCRSCEDACRDLMAELR